MSAEHHPFARAEAWLRDHRPHVVPFLEEVMSHLTDLIDNGKKLAAERSDLIVDRDAEKARADAAEAKSAELQAKIDADDKTAADAAADLAAEIAKEAGSSGSSSSASGTTSGSNSDPVVTTAPSGATVTVDTVAGTTTHVDATTGVTTTLDHESGAATAVDSLAIRSEPSPAAVAEATAAASAAGVDVPVQN